MQEREVQFHIQCGPGQVGSIAFSLGILAGVRPSLSILTIRSMCRQTGSM